MPQSSSSVFRLNLGDPSESRVYYLPHFLAEARGRFAQEGVAVAFMNTDDGGRTAMGGQIGPVVEGRADACVGGPMVTMKLLEDGVEGIVSFCALARANPWIIAARDPAAGDIQTLRGRRIIDSGNVATATLCLREILAQHGLSEAVAVEPGSGDLSADIARVRADDSMAIHHSLHALAPAIAAGQLSYRFSMASHMPPAPWSAYIARADRIAAQPDIYRRFRDAIAAALQDLRAMTARDVAGVVAPHYPGYPPEALALAIATYRDNDCFASSPGIAKADMRAFAGIMQKAGWLQAMPDIDRLLDPEVAV